MTSGYPHPEDLEPLEKEALGWIVRLTSGEATDEDARAFKEWRDRDPEHADAIRGATAFRELLRSELRRSSEEPSNVVPLRRKPAAVSRRQFLAAGGAAAAAAAGVMLVRPPYGLWPSLSELRAEHRTTTAERQSLTPMAGVAVEMNAKTALSTYDGGRGVDLIVGEVFVEIADQLARPFEVSVAGERLETRLARFNVRCDGIGTMATCLEGAVTRLPSAEPMTLRAGDQLFVGRNGDVQLRRADVAMATAWRQGVLIFKNTPLADAVEQINRYRDAPIILAGDGLGARPVNGIFHTQHIDGAITQIRQLLHLSASNLPGGVVVLS